MSPGQVTTARSAGSYGDFYVAVKWGQKQQAGITFAVTFPECLEAWTKSRGHAGDTYSFLLLCHTVPAGAPLRNCGAENNNRALALGGQLVTFLIIDAVSPGYCWKVVIRPRHHSGPEGGGQDHGEGPDGSVVNSPKSLPKARGPGGGNTASGPIF